MQIVKSSYCSLLNSFLFLLCTALVAQAEKKQTAETMIYQGGIRNCAGDDALNKKEINQLLKSLQAKTGFQTLAFNEEGFLTIADPENYRGGSGTARRLLLAALASPRQFHLEKHNSAKQISFSRLAAGIAFRNLAKNINIEIVPLMIDFADYSHLFGDADALESFDLGMIFLHELVHGVHELKDVEIESDEIGECEQFMNAIRRELNLPERDRYVARTVNAGYEFDRPIVIAQLPFVRTKAKKGKIETQLTYLKWNANRVGTIQPMSTTVIASSNQKDTRQASASIH